MMRKLGRSRLGWQALMLMNLARMREGSGDVGEGERSQGPRRAPTIATTGTDSVMDHAREPVEETLTASSH